MVDLYYMGKREPGTMDHPLCYSRTLLLVVHPHEHSRRPLEVM